jgi:hypothetical protein
LPCPSAILNAHEFKRVNRLLKKPRFRKMTLKFIGKFA